jgi:hypothetical protein
VCDDELMSAVAATSGVAASTVEAGVLTNGVVNVVCIAFAVVNGVVETVDFIVVVVVGHVLDWHRHVLWQIADDSFLFTYQRVYTTTQ